MFNALDEEPIANVITCTVGKKSSAAKYYVDDHTEVFDFISSLAECSKECEQVFLIFTYSNLNIPFIIILIFTKNN